MELKGSVGTKRFPVLEKPEVGRAIIRLVVNTLGKVNDPIPVDDLVKNKMLKPLGVTRDTIVRGIPKYRPEGRRDIRIFYVHKIEQKIPYVYSNKWGNLSDWFLKQDEELPERFEIVLEILSCGEWMGVDRIHEEMTQYASYRNYRKHSVFPILQQLVLRGLVMPHQDSKRRSVKYIKTQEGVLPEQPVFETDADILEMLTGKIIDHLKKKYIKSGQNSYVSLNSIRNMFNGSTKFKLGVVAKYFKHYECWLLDYVEVADVQAGKNGRTATSCKLKESDIPKQVHVRQ